MTPKEILDLEIGLLMLKHGRQALLHSIAKRLQLSDEALQLELDRAINSVHKETKKSTAKPFVLDSLLVGREEKVDCLRQLNMRFENRTFMPELKDVKRCFERHGKPILNWKSRTLAQSSLFQLLADLDIVELQKLLANSTSSTEVSSLGLISDEILGRRKRSP